MTIYPQRLQPILDRIDPTFGRLFHCDSGWWGLIEDMHEDIMRVDPEYRLYQVKEKFGALRVYYSPSSPIFKEQIDKIVTHYERLSLLTCEVTGKPGELLVRDGVFKTLNRGFAGDEWKSVEGKL